MAIRRLTSADLPTLTTWWDAHRTSLPEFVTETPIGADFVAQCIASPNAAVLVDTVTTTFALGLIEPSEPQLGLHMLYAVTRRTGTAAITAMDKMLESLCQGAAAAGITSIYWGYTFPKGMNLTTVNATATVKYFDTMTPPIVRSDSTFGGSVRVDWSVAPTPMRNALLVRTP